VAKVVTPENEKLLQSAEEDYLNEYTPQRVRIMGGTWRNVFEFERNNINTLTREQVIGNFVRYISTKAQASGTTYLVTEHISAPLGHLNHLAKLLDNSESFSFNTKDIEERLNIRVVNLRTEKARVLNKDHKPRQRTQLTPATAATPEKSISYEFDLNALIREGVPTKVNINSDKSMEIYLNVGV